MHTLACTHMPMHTGTHMCTYAFVLCCLSLLALDLNFCHMAFHLLVSLLESQLTRLQAPGPPTKIDK